MNALGRFVYRHRHAIVAFWLVTAVAGGAFAPRLSGELKAGGYSLPDAESERVARALERDFDFNATAPLLVFESDLLTVDDPAYRQSVQQAITAVSALDFVNGVDSYLDGGPAAAAMVSADRTVTFAVVRTGKTLDELQNLHDDLVGVMPDSGVPAIVTGTPAVYADMTSISEHDLVRAETVAMPIALLVLLLAFGTLVAAALPLVQAGMAVVLAMAIMLPIALATDVSLFALNSTTLLGLGVSIDYSLFIVSRFREEIERRPVDEAVATTVGTAGQAVAFSGMAVVIGLFALLLLPFSSLRSIGLGGFTVVTIAVVLNVTFLPAVLGMLGPRINAARIIPRMRMSGAFWAGLSRLVMRRAVPTFLLVIAFLLLLGSPFSQIRFGVPDASILPATAPSRSGIEIIQRDFDSATAPPVIVLITDERGILRPANAFALAGFADFMEQYADILAPIGFEAGIDDSALAALFLTPYDDLSPDVAAAIAPFISRNSLSLRFGSTLDNNDDRLREAVVAIRAYEFPDHLQVDVGGDAASFLDFVDTLYGAVPFAVGAVVVVTYLILVLLLGSVILPIKAVIMTVLSISASFGALVFVFQWGNLAEFFDFTPSGFVDATMPIIIFSVLFGLSMDYEIFLLSRIREEYAASGDNTEAVALGLARTGGIITSIAAIMVVIAASFTLAGIVSVKALGLGIALAVGLDATIVRGLLVPATMCLLGRWNWWAPASLTRWLNSGIRTGVH